MEMIREKLKGHKPIIAAAPERGNVVNLMDALKASLGAVQAARPRAAARPSRRPRSRPRRPRRGRRRRRRAPAKGEEVTAAAGASLRHRRRARGLPAPAGGARGGARRAAAAPRRHPAAPRTWCSAARLLDAGATPRSGAGRGRARRRPASCSSENGFLRLLGLLGAPEASALARQALLDQSRLPARALDLLSLFDAFEHDAEPYSFRDLILARKYAGLIAGGATWGAIARSVHRSGPAASLTAQSLHAERAARIYARRGERPERARRPAAARPRRRRRRRARGALRRTPRRRRRRAATPRPPRSTSAAWRSTPATRSPPSTGPTACAAAGSQLEAAHDYARAIKLDPGFVEAWFNLAGLMAERGRSRRRAPAPAQGDRARPRLRRRRLQPRLARVRRRQPRARRGAGGSATSSSTRTSDWARTAARGIQLRRRSARAAAAPAEMATSCSTAPRTPASRSCSRTAPARRWIAPR